MSDINPYQSPSTPVSEWDGQREVESVFYEAIQSLARTKPWVRFISVLGFLFFGIMLFSMLFMLGGVGGLVMMIPTLPVMVLFYLIPSVLLWNYASRIGDLLNDRSSSSLVAAVAAQKSFWRYIGIAVAIVIVFYMGILLLVGILAAVR